MITADELRPKYGLWAEYMAKILNMSEADFREHIDRKVSENSQRIREEIKEREAVEARFKYHHHHWGNPRPCTAPHYYWPYYG